MNKGLYIQNRFLCFLIVMTSQSIFKLLHTRSHEVQEKKNPPLLA